MIIIKNILTGSILIPCVMRYKGKTTILNCIRRYTYIKFMTAIGLLYVLNAICLKALLPAYF